MIKQMDEIDHRRTAASYAATGSMADKGGRCIEV